MAVYGGKAGKGGIVSHRGAGGDGLQCELGLSSAAVSSARQTALLPGVAVSQTYHITVSAEAFYQEAESSVAEDRYAFAYRITIRNTGSAPARLLSRHWIITDATGRVQEVRGMGVIGEHPHLQPGESYTYTSGSALTTPYGTMRGSYQMVADDGTRFDAQIPQFTLSIPRTLH